MMRSPTRGEERQKGEDQRIGSAGARSERASKFRSRICTGIYVGIQRSRVHAARAAGGRRQEGQDGDMRRRRRHEARTAA